jgi:hypothetical protein
MLDKTRWHTITVPVPCEMFDEFKEYQLARIKQTGQVVSVTKLILDAMKIQINTQKASVPSDK